jgi:hypothetical protein
VLASNKIEPGAAEGAGQKMIGFLKGDRSSTLGALVFYLPHDEFGVRDL